MTAPRIVVTTNGPGELMGWVRPFLKAVFERRPASDVSVVFVPCAYATGREPAQTRALFPSARVVDAKEYGRFLMRQRVSGLERSPGVLQYMGGDLFHATTIARRLGLQAMTYKFSKPSYRQSFLRFFALDAANARGLEAQGAPADRVRIVGNLVPDSVLGALSQPLAPPGEGDGICILAGSRPAEFAHLLPFFLAAIVDIERERPGGAYTLVVSPFNTPQELRAAVEGEPDPAFGGRRGSLSADADAVDVAGIRCAVDRSGDYAALARCRLVITIPGTKCIEAAVLGRPTLAILPLNRPDKIALNGIAGYVDRIPLIGKPLKARLAVMAERRFRFVAQPNIDAGRSVAPELRGVLMPADVAAAALGLLEDPQALRAMGESLSAIYAADVGAAGRMADEVLDVAAQYPSMQFDAAS